jgi:CBS domain-containing protein
MTTVAQVLEAKGPAIWSIVPEASVYEAIRLMADKEVGALLVVDAGQLVGIVSERDYARKVILQGRSSKDTAVGAIMTGQVITIRPDQTIEDALAVMTVRRIRHLPVLATDHLVGVLSIGDLVKALLADQALLIAQLEQYITGQR